LCRCDGATQCEDKSDELGCHVIRRERSYLRSLPAPPDQSNSTKAAVGVKVNVLNVLSLDEVDSEVLVQFSLDLHWRDARLTFQNLKFTKGMNSLTMEDREKIWIPEIIFSNTAKKSRSSLDEKAVVFARRNESYSPKSNSLEDAHNVLLFDGSSNDLVFSRVYTESFICDFNMRHYPFDVQHCDLILEIDERLANFVELNPSIFVNSGPEELTQYYIRSLSIKEAEGSVIVYEIELGRRLLNNLLTVHLPTFMICLLSFSTSFFRLEYFEAIVTVNLTSLLAMTGKNVTDITYRKPLVYVALFISVSEALPKTSYIKTIDVWLIANLLIPFTETLSHVAIDKYAVLAASRVHPVKGRHRPTRADMAGHRLTRFAQFGLPLIFTLFCSLYFIIGSHFNGSL